MVRFHAVMLDETRCEFGHSFEAESREAAYEYLEENYPESSCVQLETPGQSADRERAMYDHISQGGDWDEDGRPIFHYSEYDEEEDFND
jgi:hypothetical protein